MGNNIQFCRKSTLARDVVIVDGMWGTGKSILSPILGSFERIEKQQIDYNVENLCILASSNQISHGAIVSLLSIIADTDLFNSMISREVNCRPFEDTGIFSNPNTWQYIKRLFKPYDNNISAEIQNKNVALHWMTHNLLQVSTPVFDAFGDSVYLVVMVRNPVYMVEHWFNYIERVGVDPREFTLATGNDGKVPWFIPCHMDYLALNTMDKVIAGIQSLIEMQEQAKEKQKNKTTIIPFESLVLAPENWIKHLSLKLGRKATKSTSKVLRQQLCPREYIHAGKGHKTYGFNKSLNRISEADDYKRRWEFIKSNASSKSITTMKDLELKYIESYDFPREMPWDVSG